MTRDEVIRGLKQCMGKITCAGCPLECQESDECNLMLLSEAVTLLKEEPKRGRWINTPGYVTPGGDPVWRCSECGKGIHVYGIEHGTYGADVSDGQWVACPNCGAKMEGEDA